MSKHLYDVISFDFQKAFDKAPHHYIINAISLLGICFKALLWSASFLAERTQQIRVGSHYSSVCNVISGTVQGSILSPDFYIILSNSLLSLLSSRSVAHIDDFKFIVDVRSHTREDVQYEIDKVVDWSEAHLMPLSTEKCAVLHCGLKQPNYAYVLGDQALKIVDSFVDLGVTRTCDSDYSSQCSAMAAKAAKAAYVIRKTFQTRNLYLLWPAFQCYVIPIIMYASPSWSPSLAKNAEIIKHVQRRFTKCLCGKRNLSYKERLNTLNALILKNRRILADMVLTNKCLHDRLNCSPADISLTFSNFNCDNSHHRLYQHRAVNNINAALFSFRAPSQWIKLPSIITYSSSLQIFKNHYTLSCYLLRTSRPY